MKKLISGKPVINKIHDKKETESSVPISGKTVVLEEILVSEKTVVDIYTYETLLNAVK